MEQGQLDQLLQPMNRVFALIDAREQLCQIVEVHENAIWLVCSDSGVLHSIDRDKAHGCIKPAYLVRKGDYATHFELLGQASVQQLAQGDPAGTESPPAVVQWVISAVASIQCQATVI